jgi:hypothetical protein
MVPSENRESPNPDHFDRQISLLNKQIIYCKYTSSLY